MKKKNVTGRLKLNTEKQAELQTNRIGLRLVLLDNNLYAYNILKIFLKL